MSSKTAPEPQNPPESTKIHIFRRKNSENPPKNPRFETYDCKPERRFHSPWSLKHVDSFRCREYSNYSVKSLMILPVWGKLFKKSMILVINDFTVSNSRRACGAKYDFTGVWFYWLTTVGLSKKSKIIEIGALEKKLHGFKVDEISRKTRNVCVFKTCNLGTYFCDFLQNFTF